MVHVNKWAILPSMAVVGMIGVGIYEIFGPSSLFYSNVPQLALFSDLTLPTDLVPLVETRTTENIEESTVPTAEIQEEPKIKEAEEEQTSTLPTLEPQQEEVIQTKEETEETSKPSEELTDIKVKVEQQIKTEEVSKTILEVKRDPEADKKDTPTATPGSKPNIEAEIPMDDEFVKGLWGDSIGWKYRDHVILASVNHPIWQTKANKINEWLKVKKISANGWEELEQGRTLTAKEVAELCRTALNKLDWASLLTGRRKDFWDVTWDFCGKPGYPKPHNWWWP